MSPQNLVELIGNILEIHDQKTDSKSEISFALIDDHGRIMAIHYNYESYTGAELIYNSLKRLHNPRVKILVKGPISDEKATYVGVGIITILDKEKGKEQNI